MARGGRALGASRIDMPSKLKKLIRERMGQDRRAPCDRARPCAGRRAARNSGDAQTASVRAKPAADLIVTRYYGQQCHVRDPNPVSAGIAGLMLDAARQRIGHGEGAAAALAALARGEVWIMRRAQESLRRRVGTRPALVVGSTRYGFTRQWVEPWRRRARPCARDSYADAILENSTGSDHGAGNRATLLALLRLSKRQQHLTPHGGRRVERQLFRWARRAWCGRNTTLVKPAGHADVRQPADVGEALLAAGLGAAVVS
jgi:hypothetical protein